MSAPSRTYFCRSGHVLVSYGHGELGPEICDDETDECPPECVVCGSREIKCHFEWGDSDYDQLVPVKPVDETELERTDHRGNKYFVRVPVFDVEKLFRDQEEAE